MKLTNPDFSAAKLKKGREFASASMVTTLGRLKAIDSIDQLVKAPPTQTYSSGGKLPPPPRPTYQGPNDEDPLRHTVPLVPGMQQQALTKGYSPHSSERPLYERN